MRLGRAPAGRPGPAGSPFAPRVAGFLVAEALSAVGSWATIIAVLGYATYRYDATPGDVAMFGFAVVVPGIVVGPVAGAVVDRVGPKATLAMAKALGVIAALALLAADDFRTLALLSALHGVVATFTHPALQSMPPRLVADVHLARTNALVSLTDELAIVIGPVAAGVAIAAFGFRGAFIFDAITYAVGLVVLPLVRLHPPVRNSSGDVLPVRFRDALAGWRLIARTGALRRVVACTFLVHLLYGVALLTEPIYVRDVLKRPEEVYAALQIVFGIFLVAGGVLAAGSGERMASFRFVVLGVGCSGISAAVYLGTPYMAVAFLGVALWGVATALISGPSRTLIQRASPQRAHGRVLAADLVAGGTGELLGVAVAGVFVGALGVRWTILGLGTVVTATAVALLVADGRASAGAVSRGSPGDKALPSADPSRLGPS